MLDYETERLAELPEFAEEQIFSDGDARYGPAFLNNHADSAAAFSAVIKGVYHGRRGPAFVFILHAFESGCFMYSGNNRRNG